MFAGNLNLPAVAKSCKVFSHGCEFLVIIAHKKGRLHVVKGDFYFPLYRNHTAIPPNILSIVTASQTDQRVK